MALLKEALEEDLPIINLLGNAADIYLRRLIRTLKHKL